MAGSERSLVVLAALSAVIAAIFILLANHALGEGLDRVLILLAGMLTAAVLSGISQLLSSYQGMKVNNVVFDAGYSRRVMDDVIDAEFHDTAKPAMDETRFDSKREWDFAAADLLAQDSTLALAKLRIDIERQLRRIAAATDLSIDPRRSSISRLITGLGRSEVLGKGLVSTLEDIIPVCNSAVHGEKIDVGMASTVLDIGEDVLRVLETYPKKVSSSAEDGAS